ncbi:Protein ltv1 [Diatrype stigma]|uniref:Protein ltv1 n=1 Tax=Diatrype stigma TaxID=117547 RepID=A0AAN9UDD9_9PEZI
MPKGKWIDKKTAQHFTLVHRPQNDPLIHDSEAPSMVLNPTSAPNSHKSKKLDDLASELGSDVAAHVRANEGEAANYGVYYDDTEYDYMQHLRDLDSSGGGASGGGGEVVFVEAKQDKKDKSKGKQKQSLEDALRHLDDDDDKDAERKKRELFADEAILPSKNLRRLTYQAQQDVPDAIGGFKPDMDPRLREVLEALEDEAYVDGDGGDDIFQALARDGRELDDFEFEEQADFFDEEDGDDDGGWESDDTAKPNREYRDGSNGDAVPSLVPIANNDDGESAHNENWLEDFKQFKKDQKPTAAAAAGGPQKKTPLPPPSNSDLQSSLFTTTTNGGQRRKKRKGALTSQSGYSMTSSSMVRTEQLGLLDERFEQLELRHYNPEFDDGGLGDGESLVYGGGIDDDDGTASAVSGATGMSTASSVTGSTRRDFDGILDEFLGGYSMHGKKHLKKGGWKNGAEELDEIRRELGPVPAHIRNRFDGARSGGKKTKHQSQQQQQSKPTSAALAFGAPAVSR